MIFLADITLGKLVKWLRILGYDTIFYRGIVDLPCLRKAEKEGRIVLTRKQKPPGKQYSGRLFVVTGDCVTDQIGEVFEKLGLIPESERFFTRCVKCNFELLTASQEEVSGRLPPYILENCSHFRRCPSCNGVFWPGTHKENMQKFLIARIPFHRP